MDKFSVYMSGLETEGSKLAAQRAMHSQYVLQLLQLQRRAGFLCDITVNIEEKSFKAHKPLLAACSLYFRALFADSENAKTSTLNFDKLSSGGFEVLLDYIYSGSLAITSENSDQVLYAANCLQMTNVVETCLNFIRSSFQMTASENASLGKPPDKLEKELQHCAAENTQMLQQMAPGVQTAAFSTVDHVQPRISSNSSMTASESNKNTASDLEHDHRNQNHVVHHRAPQLYPTLKNGDEDIVNTSKANQQSNHDESIPQASLANPTTETLSMIMPYLVAKNARRPTLNEVRQLLLKNNSTGNNEAKSPERFSLKQHPPALIAVTGNADKNGGQFDGHPVLYSVNATMPNLCQIPAVSSVEERVLPEYTISHQKMVMLSPGLTVESNNTNQTTAHTERAPIYDAKITNSTSNEMHPFVLIRTGNNSRAPQISLGNDDSSKGCAWSDDRSVRRDRIIDQNNTHLSGTPCSANLTSDKTISASDSKLNTPYHMHGSPTSYSSSPSIEISPVSSTPSESSQNKAKCARTQSLDFSRASLNGESPARELDYRSASLSPRFRFPGDHSLISIEQATNAVGALFADACASSPKKSIQFMSPFSSSVEEEENGPDDGKLVIEETEVQLEKEDVSSAPKQEHERFAENGFPTLNCNEEDSQYGSSENPSQEDVNKDDESEISDRAIKEEYQSPTSPPPEDFAFPEHEIAGSTSSATASIDNNSRDEFMEDNFVLDLSIPKSVMNNANTSCSSIDSARLLNNYREDQNSDFKMREALDALVMMQNSTSAGLVTSQQSVFTSPAGNLFMDDSNSMAGLSRKPRRSSGGQTCQWPGCGRLFRHRNIYEEHRKLHEMGVPVTQLRKCYMGARVKKTARERLEEMRQVEGNSTVQTTTTEEIDPKHNRASINQAQRTGYGKKRNVTPHPKEGPDRKRVTVKDRKEHYLTRNVPWQPNQHSSHPSIHHSPILGTAPSIPLAVLHAVSSAGPLRHPWPSNQHQETNGIGGITQHLLNHASSLQGLPTLLSPASVLSSSNARGQPSMSPHGVSNNSAVAETLAALGIQIPTKRGTEESSTRIVSSMPLMSSPRSIMPFEHLRRAIALRESSTNYQQVLQTNISRAPSTDGQMLGNIQFPIQQALASFTHPSLATGNVTGINFSPGKSESALELMPTTHSYHGPPDKVHGPTCS